jgi:aspartyl-tRNA(Asn)/glutamyl-tRNA(Gln) amidotransferase subunit A
VIPLSWSLDHVGPLAATVSDAAVVLQAIAGYDALDVCSADVPVSDYVSGRSSELGDETKALKVGIPRAHFYDDLDGEVRFAVEKALAVIETLVACVYQPETLRRIQSGANISAADYIQRRRQLDGERRRAHEMFADVDLLITPTMPIPAPAIADLKKNPAALRPAELALLRNTRPFNVWGLPAVSVPCGFTKGGLPIGLQIAGPHWREDLVLRLAHAYEQAAL